MIIKILNNTLLFIISALVLLLIPSAYSSAEDNSDELANNSVYTFSPGYVNAAMYQANMTMGQADKLSSQRKNDSMENTMDHLSGDLRQRTLEDLAKNQFFNPDLQQKTSGGNPSGGASANALNNSQFNLAVYNVTIGNLHIGTGNAESQVYGSDNRLLSESINDVTNRYVGFGYAGTDTIAEAMSAAKAGDIIWVNAGIYSENITVGDRVKIYGVKDAGGSTPELRGTVTLSRINNYAEVAGFNIIGNGTSTDTGISINDSAGANIKIWGNTISGTGTAIYGGSSALLAENNILSNNFVGIQSADGTFRNNLIRNNDTGYFYAGSGQVVLDKNLFYRNRADISTSGGWISPMETPYPVAPVPSGSAYPPTYYQPIGAPQVDPETLSAASSQTAPPVTTGTSTLDGRTTPAYTPPAPYGAPAPGSPRMPLNLPAGLTWLSPTSTPSTTNWRVTASNNIFSSSALYLSSNSLIANMGNFMMSGGLSLGDVYTLSASSMSIGLNAQSADYSKLVFAGDPLAMNAYSSFVQGAKAGNTAAVLSNVYIGNIYHDFAFGKSEGNIKLLTNALKAMLVSKNAQDNASKTDAGGAPISGREDVLSAATLAVLVPLSSAEVVEGGDVQAIEQIAALEAVMKSPTEAQVKIIDVASSLLADMESVEKEIGDSAELQKASSGLLQMLANALLAQPVPGLSSDMPSVKGMYASLDIGRSEIVLEYNEATKPYYEEMKKLLTKNEAVLGDGLTSKGGITKELDKLDGQSLDRIIAKLKSKKNRTFEEDYLLQQEAKYREKYIDPNKKKLEDNMTVMLNDFTKKLATTLETAKKK